MSPFRPDLVEVWIFRDRTPGPSAASRSALGAAGLHQASWGAADAGAAAPDSGILADGVADDAPIEILLMRRSPGRILPGLWQCVSGSLEAGESVTDGALRELREETGFGADTIEAFYDLDQVNQFHEPSVGAIVTSAIFAVRMPAGAEPILSHEHNSMRWVSPSDAVELAVWPAYRESIRRIVENLLDPGRAIWFELTLGGARARQ